MKEILRGLRRRFLYGLARQEDLDRLYDQIAGLLQINNAMEGRSMVLPLRGWAMSPDGMVWMLAKLQGKNSPTVIEFGSGQSTVIIAASLRHTGGRFLSVEHDPEFLKGIQRQVAVSGLSEFVEFVQAPLVQSHDADAVLSYDTSFIPNEEIDVALIDGPPRQDPGSKGRLVPLRWAANHLKPGGSIFLDDSDRPSEQATIKFLLSEFPELEATSHRAEKGLVEIYSR